MAAAQQWEHDTGQNLDESNIDAAFAAIKGSQSQKHACVKRMLHAVARAGSTQAFLAATPDEREKLRHARQ